MRNKLVDAAKAGDLDDFFQARASRFQNGCHVFAALMGLFFDAIRNQSRLRVDGNLPACNDKSIGFKGL